MIKKGIIFDLDGTLWDSTKQVVPAWNIVLNRYPQYHKTITLDDMKGFMGKTSSEIAKLIFPLLDEKTRLSIISECCNEEQIYLEKHGAILYPDLKDTLNKLSETYKLYIVSNCQDGYVQTFLNFYKFNYYFEDIEMSGRTGLSKGENIKIIVKRNNLDKAIYIGDTLGDKKAAQSAGVEFIYAEYGFGNIENSEYKISRFSELPQLADTII